MNRYVILAYGISLLMMGSLAVYCWWRDARAQKDLRKYT
jgi:heme exporter protein CcmD